MSTKSKLVFFELISGVLGWIWIISSIAMLYFIAMIIFSDGTWNQFFWALGVSIISKWLAKGFNDTKIRIAFEQKLIDDGYSKEEAGKIWLEEYMKQ